MPEIFPGEQMGYETNCSEHVGLQSLETVQLPGIQNVSRRLIKIITHAAHSLRFSVFSDIVTNYHKPRINVEDARAIGYAAGFMWVFIRPQNT